MPIAGRLDAIELVLIVTVGVIAGGLITSLLVLAARSWRRGISGRAVAARPSGSRRADSRREGSRRAQFAGHLEGQLQRLELKDEWRDYRFTELEAEVEMEGTQRSWWQIRESDSTRRVSSLSSALIRSTERLVLLQGEPGSGKSVAMRHVALAMARSAIQNAQSDSTLGLYINLKNFTTIGTAVTRAEIESYVLETLQADNSRDVDAFLADHFSADKQNGRYIFLFDSFDEIPAVLSANEVSAVVEQHATALYTFLKSMNSCRGVVASREFRGPNQFGWPTFTVLSLTDRQQRQLIGRSGIGRQSEVAVLEGLATSDSGVADLANNPLFLGLICEYVRSTNRFPADTHSLLEAYVNSRLTRDADRVLSKFRITPSFLRIQAEKLAFFMNVAGLGLSPRRSDLVALVHSGGAPIEALTDVFDALIYVKLAQSLDEDAVSVVDPRFSFSHRRIQEYFATCVLTDPTNMLDISKETLLLDGRWREAAATLLQTQDESSRAVIVSVAESYLRKSVAATKNTFASDFAWPSGTVHIMSLLVAGLQRENASIPDSLRRLCDYVIESAWRTGSRNDRRIGLSLVGLTSHKVQLRLLDSALASRSGLIRNTAYSLLGRMKSVPGDLHSNIVGMIIGLSCRGVLRRKRVGVRAQVARLEFSSQYLTLIRLMLWAPVFDGIVSMGFLAYLFARAGPLLRQYWLIYILLIVAYGSCFYLTRQSRAWAWTRSSPNVDEFLEEGLSRIKSTISATNLAKATGLGLRTLSGLVAIWLAFTTGGLDSSILGLSSLAIFGAFAIYFSIWPTGLFYALIAGANPSLFLLPLYPFISLHYLIRENSTRKDWTVLQTLRQILLALLQFASFIVVPIAVLVGGVAALKLFVLPEWFSTKGVVLPDFVGYLIYGLIAIVVTCAAGYACYGLLTRLFRARLDRIKVRALHGRRISVTELADSIQALSSSASLLMLMRALRRRDIEMTPDALAYLRQIGLRGEEWLDHRKLGVDPASSVLADFRRASSLFDDAVVDEIVMIMHDRDGGN